MGNELQRWGAGWLAGWVAALGRWVVMVPLAHCRETPLCCANLNPNPSPNLNPMDPIANRSSEPVDNNNDPIDNTE